MDNAHSSKPEQLIVTPSHLCRQQHAKLVETRETWAATSTRLLTRKSLCVPGTSVRAERVFSAAANTVNKKSCT